jgi:hypothetical protein
MAQTIKLRRGGLGKLATTTPTVISTAQGEVLLGTGSLASGQLSGPILFAASEDNQLQPIAGRIPVVTNGPGLAAAINANGDENFAGLTIHSGSKFYRYVDNSTGFEALEVNAGALDLADATLNVDESSIVFITGSATGDVTRKESVTDFIAAIAGPGLTAAGGVLSAAEGVISASVGSAGANNQIAYFDGGANAIQGNSNLTFDDTDMSIGGSGKIKFRDTSNFIHSSTNGVLTIAQTTATTGKIQNTAATVEINATTANIGKIGTNDASTIVIGNGDDTADITLQGSVGIENDATVNGSKKIQFGDTGTYIHQEVDGTLLSVADTILEAQAPTIKIGYVDAATATNISIGNSNNSATITAKGDLTVSGDLTVAGTTTTVNSTTVEIGDNIIVLNTDQAASDAGIIVYEDGSAGSANTGSILWDRSNNWWKSGLVTDLDGAGTHYRLAEYWNNDTPAPSNTLAKIDASGRLTGSAIVDDGGTITFNNDVDFSNISVTFGDATSVIDGGTF